MDNNFEDTLKLHVEGIKLGEREETKVWEHVSHTDAYMSEPGDRWWQNNHRPGNSSETYSKRENPALLPFEISMPNILFNSLQCLHIPTRMLERKTQGTRRH